MNVKFQNALQGVAQPVPPIWFMRQAGRYHGHYQKLRQAHSFMELCKSPRLAAEVALGPVEDFDFDVAILFSDLLFPLEALGMGLTYDPAPRLGWKLSPETIARLRPFEKAIEDLGFQEEALRETRKVLPANKSLIGFVGGPWTLYTYAVEGEHKGSLTQSKSQPALYRRFSDLLLPLLEANIELQLRGGAEVVMLFDTAAGELAPADFRQWIQPDLMRLALKFPGRLGYYAKGIQEDHWSELRARAPFAGFGVDHRWDLARVLKENARGFIQGCFDQALLFQKGRDFENSIAEYLRPLKLLTPVQRRHWVSGLGHGVLPATPEENVRTLIRRLREELA